MNPLLLLDVDGVLLPFGGKFAAEVELITLPWGQIVPALPSNRHRLARLREEFELHWGSMWQDAANETVGPWHNLPPLPYVPFIRWEAENFSYENEEIGMFIQSAVGKTYKLPGVIDYVGSRPFAWVDDHIFQDAREWAHERNQNDLPTLLIRTQPHIGLTDADVEHLLAFSKAVREFRKPETTIASP